MDIFIIEEIRKCHLQNGKRLIHHFHIGNLIIFSPGNRIKTNILFVIMRCQNHHIIKHQIIRELLKEGIGKHGSLVQI